MMKLLIRRILSTTRGSQAPGTFAFIKKSANTYCSNTSKKWGSSRHAAKRNVVLKSLDGKFYSPVFEEQLQPYRIRIKEQGDLVRNLKASGASVIDVTEQVKLLKSHKKELEDMILKLTPVETFDKAKFEDVLKQQFFYDTSFSIYGGGSGQCDYGPVGCNIIDNIISEWHKFFVMRDSMHKINCTSLTPASVLQASGHVEKFADYAVKDTQTGELIRLDHLIKGHLENILRCCKSEKEKEKYRDKLSRVDGMSPEELTTLLRENNIKSPSTGNDVTDAIPFNLMYPIGLDMEGSVKGFLRPETAQGIFVNFERLLDYNVGKLPMVCAQVGSAFRNEITSKGGILRMKEFTLAEIEHFCFPDQKNHSKFSLESSTELWIYSSCNQMEGEPARYMTIKEALDEKIVSNEILGYYMARICKFLVKIGIDRDKIRFRQHTESEMAHYASDCWDVDCLTSRGWIECVGCADRSSFDLQRHAEATGLKMAAQRYLAEPRMARSLVAYVDKRLMMEEFKDQWSSVNDTIQQLSQGTLARMRDVMQTTGSFDLPGGGARVTAKMVPEIVEEDTVVHVEDVVPCVIEPSFGIGRIFYALLENSFRARGNDAKRIYFALPASVAPIKAAILPLVNKEEFNALVHYIADLFTDLGLSVKIGDMKSSIGRRYARSDLIGIPFAVTVDEETVDRTPGTVTLRERDSMAQVRIPIDDLPETVDLLCRGRISWKDVLSKWPLVSSEGTNS